MLTLVLTLLVASPGGCYLVTNARIHEIPCDFKASATDALRYAAEDAGEARSKRPEPQQRADAGPQLKPPPASQGYSRRRSRGDSTR